MIDPLGCFCRRLFSSPLAVHLLGPAEAEDLHELKALGLGALAQPSAWHRHAAVLGAHGRVQGAEEGPQVGGALQVHHGMKGLWVGEGREVRGQSRYVSNDAYDFKQES